MPIQIGSLYLPLTVDLAGYGPGLSRAEAMTRASMGRVERSIGAATRASGGFQRSISTPIRPYAAIAAARAFETASSRAGLLRGTLLATTAAFGGFTAALSSNILSRYADTSTQLSNRLNAVSRSADEAAAKFEVLQEIATRSRADISSTITLFSRLSKAQPDRDPRETLRTVETIQKALQLGGATAQEAASAAIQFSQAIASNRLGGEELRAVLETPLGSELARGLGVSIGKFRELGYEGKLTADVLFGALAKIGASVDAQFVKSIPTLENALTQLDNAFIENIGSMNEQYRVTRRLGSGIVALANNLDTVLPTIAAFGLGLGAIFGGRLLGRAGQNSVGRLFSSAIAGVAKTKAEIDDATDAIRRQQSELEELRRIEAQARQRSLGDTRGLADRSVVSEFERAREDSNRASRDYQMLVDKQIKARETLAAVTSSSSARVVKSVNDISTAERKLHSEIEKSTELRKKLIATTNLETAALARASQIGETASTRAATSARLAAEKQVLAQQARIAAQAEAITARRLKLDALEADSKVKQSRLIFAAQQRLLTVENAIQETQARALGASSAVGVLDQRVVASGRNAANADLSAAVLARQGVQGQLSGSAARLEAARKAASALGLAVRGVGVAFASLAAFLGGTWGIIITGAIVGFSMLGSRALRAAEDTARAQEIIADELGRIAEKSKEARYELEKLEKAKSIDGLKERASILSGEINNSTAAIVEMAANLDNLMQTRGDELLPGAESAVSFFSRLNDELSSGKITIDQFIASARQFGKKNLLPEDLISEITGLTSGLEKVSLSAIQVRTRLAQAETDLANFVGPSELDKSIARLGKLRVELAAFRKQEAEVGTRVGARADDLRELELMTEKERRIRQIRDDILSDEAKAGTVITNALKTLAEQRAREIELMRRIKEQGAETFQAAGLAPEGGFPASDPNRKTVGGSERESIERAARLYETAEAVRRLKSEISLLNLSIAEASRIRFADFLPPEVIARSGAEIAAAQQTVQQLVERVRSGSIRSLEFTAELEKVRAKLQEVGAGTMLDPLLDYLTRLILKVSSLNGQIAATSAVASLAASSGAGNAGLSFSRSSFTVPGENGPVPVNVTGGVLTKNSEDMLDESRETSDAVRQAQQEAAYAEEIARQQREEQIALAKAMAGSLASRERKTYSVGIPNVRENWFGAAKTDETGATSARSNKTPSNEFAITQPLPRFATGGYFRVGGAGGLDSRLVQFMASPNEHVGVFTPEQWDAMKSMASPSVEQITYNVPTTVIAANPNTYRNSRQEIRRDMAATIRGASR